MKKRELARPTATLPRDPRGDLTPAEATALEGAGFVLELADQGSEDPLTRTTEELAALLKTSLSPQAVAERLGVSPTHICQRLTSEPPSLYGLRLESGWVIPEFQLDGNRLLPGLGEVIARLDAELHPLSVYRWFTLRNPDLVPEDLPGPLSPRDWLRRGLPGEPVADLAADL